MITGDCKTCTPCEGCEAEKSLCEVCEPCSKSEICPYCGNGFCQCDHIAETEDGPMHVDCASKGLV